MQLEDNQSDSDEVTHNFSFVWFNQFEYPVIDDFFSAFDDEEVQSLVLELSSEIAGTKKHKQRSCEKCKQKRHCGDCHLTCICGAKFPKKTAFHQHLR